MSDPVTKKTAFQFLKKTDFHQNLRLEILFGLIPKTFEPSDDQRHSVGEMTIMMMHGGFLRNQGVKSLATIRAFETILNTPLDFKYCQLTITEFFNKGKSQFFTVYHQHFGSGNKHWPVAMVNQRTHIITLKAFDPARKMLLIRDSAKPSNSTGDIWIDNTPRDTILPDKLTLSANVCLFFSC